MRARRCARALPLLLVVAAAACDVGGERFSDPGPFSDREARAARLVGTHVHETVTCRDNGAVNSEILPEYPVGYRCRNEDAQHYFAVVSSNGALTSLSGPLNLKHVGRAPSGPPEALIPVWQNGDGVWVLEDATTEPPAARVPPPPPREGPGGR
jgi:hypothetical protein